MCVLILILIIIMKVMCMWSNINNDVIMILLVM